MEATITVDKVSTQRWEREDVLKLAHHFHKLEKGQYHRATCFEMSDNDVISFKAISSINSIKICMALEKRDKKSNISFCPYIEVNTNEKYRFCLTPSISRPKRSDYFSSAIVPGVFKEMIWNNWDKLEMNKIDDLFHCQNIPDRGNNGVDQDYLVRVNFFWLSDDVIQLIQQIKSTTRKITLYPGVDMNKVEQKHMISFTPVLGFTHDEGAHNVDRMGVIESTDTETLIEYSTPCPPTCP
ncbi:hypothetical protein [Aquimarina intermedia]|uniref:Uncharacterized protein n=1 Tax=Aquimarina intermedia TaxID=350814 RepID=A0A5S5CG82_9FLAO|nr:hypothetical protein [Aquimarina intermedia]TYP77023.1 hypothetical protein BD809_101170 [Aquimarina intermedia]